MVYELPKQTISVSALVMNEKNEVLYLMNKELDETIICYAIMLQVIREYRDWYSFEEPFLLQQMIVSN